MRKERNTGTIDGGPLKRSVKPREVSLDAAGLQRAFARSGATSFAADVLKVLTDVPGPHFVVIVSDEEAIEFDRCALKSNVWSKFAG